MNTRIVVDAIYGPLVQLTVSRWHRPELTLVLERTEWDAEHSLVGGVALLGRVLPLAWTILSHQGSSDCQEPQALVERVRPWWPAAPQKARVGDGECKSVAWMRYAQALGWDCGLGQSADTRFQEPSGTWPRLGNLPVPQPRPLYRTGIFLTREQACGPVNLIASWDRAKREQRSVATSRPATRATFTWGRQRSWMEGLFRDDKSGGFNLEDTHLTDADRLDRLVVVMAIGYLWCFHVGRWLFKTGQRRLIDAAKQRTLSSFRLGLDWLRRAINIGQPVKIGFAVYT